MIFTRTRLRSAGGHHQRQELKSDRFFSFQIPVLRRELRLCL